MSLLLRPLSCRARKGSCDRRDGSISATSDWHWRSQIRTSLGGVLCLSILLVVALAPPSEPTGLYVVSSSSGVLNMGDSNRVPHTLAVAWPSQKLFVSVWASNNTISELSVMGIPYHATGFNPRIGPYPFISDMSLLTARTLLVWDQGEHVVACTSNEFFMLNQTLRPESLRRTYFGGIKARACVIDQIRGHLWVETRVFDGHGTWDESDRLLAYDLYQALEMNNAPSIASVTIPSSCQVSQIFDLRAHGDVLILPCSDSLHYMDLGVAVEDLALQNTPKLGSAFMARAILQPPVGTNLWYFATDFGVEQWHFVSPRDGPPTYRTVSASGFYNPSLFGFWNNINSGTIYWATYANSPGVTLSQLGVSATAFLNPVPNTLVFSLPSAVGLRAISIDQASNRLFVAYRTGSMFGVTGMDVAMVGFGDCSLTATTCDQCIGDADLECGWCASASSPNGGSCLAAHSCHSHWFQDVCPLLRHVSSIDPLVTGLPFVLQLDATLFFDRNISCALRSTTSSQVVPLNVIPAAAPLCGIQSPSHPVLKSISGDYTVEVALDGNIVYPTPQNIHFVNCSTLPDCHSCNSASVGCNWCIYDGACVNTATPCSVSGPAWQRPTTTFACPVQGPITPSSAMLPIAPGSAITIQASSLVTPTSGVPYSCSFDIDTPSPLTSPGSFISPSAGVSCALPSPPNGFIGASNVSLVFRGHAYADNTNVFTYYDCNSPLLGSCGECLAPSNAQCAWNTATSQCNIASSCTSGADCRSVCPSITLPLSLRSFHVTDDVGAVITITGTHFTSTFPSTWTCDFGLTGVAPTTAATWVSTTQITCPVPMHPNPSFFTPSQTIFPSELTLLHGGKTYVSPVAVNWYSCDGTNCSSCLLGDLAPKCRWNFNAYSCGLLTANQLPACPKISTMSDTFAHVTGGLTLTVKPATAPDAALSYRCAWTSFSDAVPDIFETATLASGDWTCMTPNVSDFSTSASMTSTFSIQADSPTAGWTDYISNPESFTFFDCITATSCSSCLLSSQCYWVNYTVCTSSVAPADTVLHLQCPTLTSITPEIQAVGTATTVTVIVEGMSTTEDWSTNYMCRWKTNAGGFIHTAVTQINATALSCPFQRTYYDLHTEILDFDLAYQYETPLTANQLPYEVYDCAVSPSCGLCSQIHPKCGWCSDATACTDRTTCDVLRPGSGFVRDDCPFVNKINPPFTALGRTREVTFSGTFGTPTSPLQCRFVYGSTTSIMLANVSSSTTVSCTLPEITTPTSMKIELGQMVTLSKKRMDVFVQYIPDVFTFDFFSCEPPVSASSCSECYAAVESGEIDQRCGWCGYDSMCADQYSCNAQFNAHFSPTTENSCPRIHSISPSSGSMDGGTEITVTGSFFFQGTSGTECGFGPQLVPATVTTATTLKCTTPNSKNVNIKKSGQSITVDVFWKGVKFTVPGDFKFLYKKADPAATIAIAVVLSTFGLIILLVIILFIVFYKKIREKRNQRRFLKLREPDYAAVAFSNTKGIDLTITPSDQKALSSFMRALDNDTHFAIIFALSQAAPGNQADYLCRAAIYFYQTRNRALDLLLAFVSAEVKASEHEGTLFRASSFACKLFNQYARLHGLPYLWKTLGFYVNQLAEFAKEERSEERDDILGPGSMEVDPDRYDGDEEDAPDAIDIRLNQYELLARASKILKAIFASLPHMRTEFKTLCARVKQEVGAKFPDNNADYKAVGGFIFLRFICPSIMAPHVYGLLENPPNETAQRYFVLLSKSLQNLANETLPGTNEDFMARMNEFITKNLHSLHVWVDNLCSGAGEDASSDDPKLTIPEPLFYSSLGLMQHMVVDEWDRVSSNLPEEQVQALERSQQKGRIGKKPKAANPPRRKAK